VYDREIWTKIITGKAPMPAPQRKHMKIVEVVEADLVPFLVLLKPGAVQNRLCEYYEISDEDADKLVEYEKLLSEYSDFVSRVTVEASRIITEEESNLKGIYSYLTDAKSR